MKKPRSYKELRENGLCVQCRNRPSEDGMTMCRRCRVVFNQRQIERKKKLTEQGRCYTCCKPLEDKRYKMCAACRAFANKKVKARQQERVDAGLCIRCAKPREVIFLRECNACRALRRGYGDMYRRTHWQKVKEADQNGTEL